MKSIAFVVAMSCAFATERRMAGAAEPDSVQRLRLVQERIRSLHVPLGKPQPGDWLLSHPEEGQTFAEYLACRPVVPKGKRKVIYIQPLGDFTPTQRKIVSLTGDFMERYFDRAVIVLPDMGLSVIPAKARRKHPSWGMDQILSLYVLDDILKPKLPADAAVCIAFTASDLWPGDGWNFVFGQASLCDRVGVWSIYRNGDPDKNDEAFRLCLLRTLKVATHETGHMFSIQHCTKYECNMCGSNSLAESDRYPLEACPECVAKIWWATDVDPAKRYRRLAEFCKTQGLTSAHESYDKLLQAVSSK